MKKIFEFLKNGFQEISNSLDLSFEDDSVAEEKIPFLAYLASILKEKSFFPYEPPSGSKHFRSLIAGFLKAYHHVPLSAEVRTKKSFSFSLFVTSTNLVSVNCLVLLSVCSILLYLVARFYLSKEES